MFRREQRVSTCPDDPWRWSFYCTPHKWHSTPGQEHQAPRSGDMGKGGITEEEQARSCRKPRWAAVMESHKGSAHTAHSCISQLWYHNPTSGCPGAALPEASLGCWALLFLCPHVSSLWAHQHPHLFLRSPVLEDRDSPSGPHFNSITSEDLISAAAVL